MSDEPDTPPERVEELLDFAQDIAVKLTEGMFGKPYLMPPEVLTVLSLVCQDVCYRRAYCLSKSDSRHDKEFKEHLIVGIMWLSRELELLGKAHHDGTVDAATAANDAKLELERVVRTADKRRKRREA
jgi:hypothetical protein